MRQIGFSYTQIFLLSASYEILIFFLEVPTGAFADLFGLKKTVTIGHFISAASCFPVALFPTSYGVFLFWSVLSAICTTLNSGSVEALQYESLREISREAEYSSLRGRLAAIGGLTGLIGAFAGGVICDRVGFSWVVASGGLTGMLSTAVFASMHEPETAKLERETGESRSIFVQTVESLRTIKSDKGLGELVVMGAGVYAAYYLINNYSQPCLERVGIQSYLIVGFISSTFTATFAIASWLAGYVKRRVRARRLLTWICGVPILSLIGLGKLEEMTLLGPLYFTKMGEGVADPIISELLLRKSPSGKSATLLSIQSLFTSLLFSVWSMATGLGLDNANPLFTFAAGAGFLSLVLLWSGLRLWKTDVV